MVITAPPTNNLRAATPAPAPAPEATPPAVAPEGTPTDIWGEELKPESPSGGLKQWFFTQKRVKGEQTQGSPFNKLTLGMVAAGGAWCAYKVGLDIVSSPSLAVAAGKVALNAAALAGGYLAADLPSGMLHHWADNYADPQSQNAFVKKFAKQAQRHHFYPGDLGKYALSAWASPLSIVGWAPLAGAAALGAASPVLAGLTGLVGGMSVYGKFHEWSHTSPKNVPPYAKFMQKIGLAVDPKGHGKHHAMPWNSDYCIVHGHLNKPLDAIKFWPRYEKFIHAVTGKAPESWNVKEYKDYVDGKISKEEYISKMRDIMKEFRQTEYVHRKEKWGIEDLPPREKKEPAAPREVNFDNPKPAHRSVKKLARAGAGAVGLAGLAKAGYDVATGNYASAVATVGVAGAAIVGMDLASGLWHHHGDNYTKDFPFDHTKWHTDTQATDYCLVGVSNKALDAIGFWPKWEKLTYNVTGQEPLAWQVPPYKAFALGEIDEATMKQQLTDLGMKS